YEKLKGSPTFDHYLFDDRGWVWMTHRRWAGTYQAGIACLNYNGTLSNKADDQFNLCTTFTDQNGTTTQLSLLYHFALDHDGKLWIGTDQGVFVLEDPTTIFNTKQTFRRPLIPRNDGTNYADYLLDGVPVKCIVVDGANRKWMGTTNNGLYLVSEDGLEILEHFTAENSPLLSNTILSLALRPDNGLLMIGTDKGLNSYRGDATEPAEKLKESNIKVFPNPVRPDFDGKIRITGFTADSDIKITTTTGLLVAQGTSLGGTFIWDGRNKAGDRVATGIYLVIASDADAKDGVVAKILMVK
ncbi:MAG: Por secretion system protein, partial [Bacteroidaceae bacterium]|nr:Por secretion system protein [Bacteroidaceae bacterium]